MRDLAHLLVVPQGFVAFGGYLNDEIVLIDSLCTTRAFENNILFIYCNAGGILEGIGVDTLLSGRSQVTHPQHKVVAQCEGNEEKILMVDTEIPEPVKPLV